MFEHFTFGAISQSPCHNLLESSPSPTDTSFPSPITPPPTSYPSEPRILEGIDDLASRLEEHSLSSRNVLLHQFASWSCTPSPSFVPSHHSGLEIDTSVDYSMDKRIHQTASVPTTPIDHPSTSRGGIASRRLKRQLNVQLQCERGHVRDINMLVEGMITSSSQCRLRKTPSTSHVSSLTSPIREGVELVINSTEIVPRELDVDEGFCDMEIDPLLEMGVEMVREAAEETTLRRASTPSGIRKYNANANSIKWGRSADVVCVNGKIKVKSRPRMRMRKRKGLERGVESVPE